VRDYVEYNKVVGVEPEDMAPAQEPEMPEQPEIVKVQAPVPEAKPNPLYDNELADIVTLATRRTR
jgi:hypothetical protein